MIPSHPNTAVLVILHWLKTATTVACGMVGSRQGWVKHPIKQRPARMPVKNGHSPTTVRG
jgi:2-keto-3-deoxy-galactonokinase